MNKDSKKIDELETLTQISQDEQIHAKVCKQFYELRTADFMYKKFHYRLQND